jgi:starch phosphorylase
MSEKEKNLEPPPTPTEPDEALAKLLKQYGFGPVQFTGKDGLYERHLLFDNIGDVEAAGLRERFEAGARAVRDVLSQRWVLTKDTYEQKNPKRIYYLSMEFLIGRSLANNVTNLLLDPLVKQIAQRRDIDWHLLPEEEPDAGLGNGGLGCLAACFLDSMATMELPAMDYGLRYEYAADIWNVKPCPVD